MYLSGFLFHPDELAESIVDIASGQPTFTHEECVRLNRAVKSMFDNHGDKVCDVGLKYFHKAMGIKPRIRQSVTDVVDAATRSRHDFRIRG